MSAAASSAEPTMPATDRGSADAGVTREEFAIVVAALQQQIAALRCGQLDFSNPYQSGVLAVGT